MSFFKAWYCLCFISLENMFFLMWEFCEDSVGNNSELHCKIFNEFK
jgi:hypothetical protein